MNVHWSSDASTYCQKGLKNWITVSYHQQMPEMNLTNKRKKDSRHAGTKLDLCFQSWIFLSHRGECACTPVRYFVILSMQRSGSGWFETLLNSHPNISSNGEIFSVPHRRGNLSTIFNTLDTVYNLDWFSSAAKNECTAAYGLKWMLNQVLNLSSGISCLVLVPLWMVQGTKMQSAYKWSTKNKKIRKCL